jgi:hypothetical protein
MPYPGNKVHRRNRRSLQRGQGPFPGVVGVTITGTGSTATATFSSPVNVDGTIAFTVASLTLTTQTVVSPTVVTFLMSGALTGHAFHFPSADPAVSSYEGGLVAGASGTF